MKIFLIIGSLAIFLTGCDKPVAAPKVLKPASARDHIVVVRDVKGNELIVLEVPAAGIVGLPENTNCFVWRDHEFKTASISCTKPELALTKD